MKRKLIKRNKQFLSSRYGKGYQGNGSFQRLTSHLCYFDNDDNLTFKRRRYSWVWFYKPEFIEEIIREIDDETTSIGG
jgi:hypothetical protein